MFKKMKIGIAAENRPNEKRVILRPQELKDIAARHEVLVEKGAGAGIGTGDSEYEKVGARIADKKEVYACALVVRIKAPVEEEVRLMKPGSTIMSMMHLRAVPLLAELLKKYRVNAVPLEKIKDEFGRRKIEALHETGYLGMEKALELWGGDPEKAVVKVMGYGNVACGAIQCAARKFARVAVLNKRDIFEMEKHIPGTDVLVNGLKWPHGVRGKVILIRREMLKLFKKGSVILDLIANPPGQSPIETCHPTTLDNIAYEVDGIIHACCWGWPGLDPVGVSRRYSIQLAPILLEIADKGFENAPEFVKNAMVRIDAE
jgi:alanine dehydrogenase